jgi:hypothetical protein
MAKITITGKVKIAWWLKPYFYGVAAMSALTGLDPDWEKVTRVIDRAISFKFESTSEGIGGA